MAKKTKQTYRLRVVHGGMRPYNTYIVRYDDARVAYMSGDESPLALSNLIHTDAAAMRFALEDALDGTAAAKALRGVLAAQFATNAALTPKVEVL